MKQIIFFVCIFSFHVAIARDLLLHDKLTFEIEKLIQSPEDSSRLVDILVKGDSEEIKFFMESNNGIYKYTVGRISSVRIPVSKITALASLSSVVKLNYHDCIAGRRVTVQELLRQVLDMERNILLPTSTTAWLIQLFQELIMERRAQVLHVVIHVRTDSAWEWHRMRILL